MSSNQFLYFNIVEKMNWYDYALNINPNCHHTLTNQGILFFQIGMIKEAKKCFEKSIMLKSSYFIPNYYLEKIQNSLPSISAA